MPNQKSKYFFIRLILLVPLFVAIAATISTATLFMVEGAKGNQLSFWAFVMIVVPWYIIGAICWRIRRKLGKL
ncbi:hypothetical protein ABIC37_004704 [Priestia megaterium]|uniref:hypothetical protein n=1 Tax=Priestia TaxID=2800373 RepID=UPI0004713A53|nr:MULTISPECIES: hypothetical protein [Priestia]TCN08160.1 hypothetical protein EV581_10769 [Bacillus sp. BK006]MBU3571430.1 hypothetical protein [Priestia aryabhattai]MCM3020936.1 hypothetical protein [Priestia megaterium]MCM3186136.1 hypothetical protein [Priestia megaterium]MCM3196393.1 hypothetical protein [Priestia megaterium]